MIKKIFLGILFLFLIAASAIFITILFRKDRTFEAPYPDLKASTDSAVIARGRYLVYGPAHCSVCHAPTSEFVRIDKGEEVALRGGFNFNLPIGTIYAPNITPDPETGIGKLSDGEIARALRYGVRHDGKALLDFMPFYDLGDQDLIAIISYLRVQPPVNNQRPQHDLNFLGNAVFAFLIEPMGDGDVPAVPAADTTVEYGKYLAESVANCRGCHTARDMQTGAYIGPMYAGQMKMAIVNEKGEELTDKHLVTQNITPDKETGRMNGWTKRDFISRFRNGRIIAGSPMPWGPFSRMNDLELTAIYKFLNTLEPVKSITPLGIQDGTP
jgi:mono/diheme cytochrome c family protein